VLILDEPTSALLPEQVQWLFGKVREFAAAGGIALFISHRLEEIESLSDRVTVLRGGVDVGSGPIAEMAEARLVELMLAVPSTGCSRSRRPSLRRRRSSVRSPTCPRSLACEASR